MMISTANYAGADRRLQERRQSVDRRDMIRFEPEKNPRRCGSDRRKGLNDQWDRRDI